MQRNAETTKKRSYAKKRPLSKETAKCNLLAVVSLYYAYRFVALDFSTKETIWVFSTMPQRLTNPVATLFMAKRKRNDFCINRYV